MLDDADIERIITAVNHAFEGRFNRLEEGQQDQLVQAQMEVLRARVAELERRVPPSA